jgi:hypothetical protein
MTRAANADDDPMQAIDSIVAIVAIGLLPSNFHPDDLTEDQKKLIASGYTETVYNMRLANMIDQIEDELLGPEVPGLKDAALEIMQENGLIRRVGNPGLEGNETETKESPSTEISTESSQNSSLPGVLEETGTE